MTVRNLRFIALGCAVLSLIACASRDMRTATIDGQAVADRLNARYLNTVDDCAGQPAYLCSGVPVRVLDPFNPSLQPLEPSASQIERNGISFTVIRKDLNITSLYQAGWAGFVVDMENKSGFVPLQTRCAFPVNATTNTRPDACGYSKDDPTPTLKSRPCAQQGVNTPQAWGAHFRSLPVDAFSCGFDASTEGYRLSMASRAFIPEDSHRYDQWNEVVVGAWTQEQVRELPVEAVFYTPTEIIPIHRVLTQQCRIFFATGRRIPLLKMDLEHANGTVFSFNQADQIDFDNATPACSYAPKTGARP